MGGAGLDGTGDDGRARSGADGAGDGSAKHCDGGVSVVGGCERE